MSNVKFEENERVIDFVERQLSDKFQFAWKFSADVIDPFIKKWEGILEYERNRIPSHPIFLEFKERVSDVYAYPLGHIGMEAAIKYYLFCYREKIPRIQVRNFEIIVEVC